jgi:putative transposase
MILTYDYRLIPSKAQHRALEEILESQRLLYNAALEERIGAYRRGVKLTCFDQHKGLTEWRQSDPEAASVPLNLQRATLKRLDEAYKGFFRRVKHKTTKAGFPRFRGRGWWDSFGFREFSGISFDGTCLRFKGMPRALKVHMHRPMAENARIRSCTFRRDPKGWKVGFAVDVAVAEARKGERSTGVDLGISTFAVLSDGGFIPSLKAARRAQRRLRAAQRSLSRKQPRSKSRSKARRDVARSHAATPRVRSNYLHQASARLVRDYDVIAVEALNVQGLARSALARDVHDASWAKFLSMIRYKAARAGVRVIEVNPRNSSQECSGCGTIVPKSLDERWHDCPHCGLSIDRDMNAARNILGRAVVGPCLPNVADCGKRAGGNLALVEDAHPRHGPKLRH